MENKDAELLLRYCSKRCTEPEKREVETRLSHSIEFQKCFVHLQKSISLQADIKEMESIDVKASYKRMRSTIGRRQMKRLQDRLMRYAAMLSLPLFLISVTMGYFYFRDSDEQMRYASIMAAAGSVVRYELPDSSIVWLNSGSTLRYPTAFTGATREVELDGEAYFEVQSDKKHPFYVNTGHGVRIYVYGTQFNVAAYKHEEFIETVLESGSVNVIMPNYSTAVKLYPGERILFDKASHQYTKSQVDVSQKTAWRSNKLLFRDAPLSEVFQRLSRHFNVDIRLNNRSGKEYKYRATFRNETLTQILDYLSRSADMKWRVEEPMQLSDSTFTKQKIIVDLY